MKKKTATTKRAAVAKTKSGDLAALITEVRDLIQSARRSVASVVDTDSATLLTHEQLRQAVGR